jgi:uncharacterized membrane protein
VKYLKIIPCHRRPDRSLFIKGKQMPLCARCTAIYGAYLLLPLFYFVPYQLWMLILGVLLQLPMLIDGLTQRFKMRESNNTLRVITGGLSGIGQCLLIWFFARSIIYLIQSLT